MPGQPGPAFGWPGCKLDPRIHLACELFQKKRWIAGSSPATTMDRKPEKDGPAIYARQPNATLSSVLAPNVSDERATARPPSAR